MQFTILVLYITRVSELLSENCRILKENPKKMMFLCSIMLNIDIVGWMN